ncbi:30S ribosomal protein S6 [Patescibacteria group bacterium]
MAKETKYYEIAYLVRLSIGEDKINTVESVIKNKIQDKNGIIESCDPIKKRTAAYPIEKETVVYFSAIRFSINPSYVNEIKSGLNEEENILRFLIVEWQKSKTRPPPIITTIPKIVPETKSKPDQSTDEKPQQEKIKTETIDERLEEILK